MKKHFTGIALFVFIIGISGFVAGLFVEIPKTKVFEVQVAVPKYEGKKKCSKKYKKSESDLFNVKVEQAIYNEKTKLLYTNFLIERDTDDLTEELKVDLHFFVQEPHSYPQFLTTERVLIKPNFKGDFYSNRFFSVKAIKELSVFNNLYVVAEPKIKSENYDASGEFENTPAFNYEKATAVLIGKNSPIACCGGSLFQQN